MHKDKLKVICKDIVGRNVIKWPCLLGPHSVSWRQFLSGSYIQNPNTFESVTGQSPVCAARLAENQVNNINYNLPSNQKEV